ncbi:TetR family transcriptional regulator [Massilia sp. Root351]|jgi:TetR/AcrR family tetracycline transcriptional repressor|uniref:TetR/AcrR family transcriptional regulator C-terminal domain-containing protein n=1 Tax=Massilia sp. Root351 TaxID=1736522 RepID=UPI00070943A1|nr:TetR/AcrR family transcriptional regulator C-terminal domain-containing protein [Massilia sp. Root351]KQV85060.1 TetR family transcriptional regulator [Massilia sp. Root351]
MAIQKDAVIAKALELLDETGLEGLTMRRLADALEIKAASLYWHFASKQVLLDGMADALMYDVARSAPDADSWQQRLMAVAGEVRRALLARRDGARVFAGTYVVSENVMRVGEALMTPLHDGGANPRTASWGAFGIMYFILGFVIEESGIAPEHLDAKELMRRGGDFASKHAMFPHLTDAREHIFDPDFDSRFVFGMETMIAGLAARIAAEA